MKKIKPTDQLLAELDALIEADYQQAKAELEAFKNRPNVFTLFTLEETNNSSDVTNEMICSIFEGDEQLSNNYGEGSIA